LSNFCLIMSLPRDIGIKVPLYFFEKTA
jgi:hypothetical protein